jgi:hypothetical protein
MPIKPAGATSADTSTVPTPDPELNLRGASVMNPEQYLNDEKEKKRYFDLFKASLSSSFTLMHNSYSGTIKLLDNRSVILEFPFNVVNIKNYYCSFRLSGNDARNMTVEDHHANFLKTPEAGH